MTESQLMAAARSALVDRWGDVEVRLVGERLPGSPARSAVWRAIARCTSGAEHRIVIKAAIDNAQGFRRERAALTVTGARHVPGVVELLGVWENPPLLLLADVGDGATVADRLLGPDPNVAQRALCDWARTVARLQAATWDARPAFNTALQATWNDSEPVLDSMPSLTAESVGMLEAELSAIGLRGRAGALQELAEIPRRLDVSGPEAPGALVPGDTCPDNAVEQRGELVLLDFESADYRHVAWEAAYLLVPWPTCWCSWRLPQEAQDRALGVWRKTLQTALPFIASAQFQVDIAQAVVCWAVISATWDLRPVLHEDLVSSTPHRVPPRRATVEHRLQVATHWGSSVPELQQLAADMLEVVRDLWGDRPLSYAPAFG